MSDLKSQAVKSRIFFQSSSPFNTECNKKREDFHKKILLLLVPPCISPSDSRNLSCCLPFSIFWQQSEDLFPCRPSHPHTKPCSSPLSCHVPSSCSTSCHRKLQWRWATFVLLHLLLFLGTEKTVKFINSKLGTENQVTGLKQGNIIYSINVYCICFTIMPAPGQSSCSCTNSSGWRQLLQES